MTTIKEVKKLKDTGLTYQEIGDLLGISRQRAHQILHPEKYKPYRKVYQKAYQKTAKYKDYQKAYKKTAKYQEYQKVYQSTTKFKASRHNYYLKRKGQTK